MSQYRKIHLEMYADERYRSLSKPQPCGQVLWVYLLTGPHTTAIPGLSSIGEAALAEMLEWSLKDFRKAFSEIQAKGMAKADWKNRVVWIPNGVKYNPPESPNVVKSWGKQWGMIPQCELKGEARTAIIKLLSDSDTYGPVFRKVFREAFKEDLPEGLSEISRHPSAKGSPPASEKPSGNQEQEQEQEQEQKQKQERAHQPSKEPDPLVVGVRKFIQDHPRLIWNQRMQDRLVDLVREKGWPWCRSAIEGRLDEGDGDPIGTLLNRRNRNGTHPKAEPLPTKTVVYGER